MELLLKFMQAIIDLCQHILHFAIITKRRQKKRRDMHDGSTDNTVGTENLNDATASDTTDDTASDTTDATLTIIYRTNAVPCPYAPYLDMYSTQMRKLPFFLLEDTVDTFPIPIIQVLWKYSPSQWL